MRVMVKYTHENLWDIGFGMTTAKDETIIFARMIMGILDSWGLTAKQQHSLLDLSSKVPTRALRRYREDTPFPDEPGINERLEHIVGIYEALRTSYPHNPAMGAMWMTKVNSRFDDKPPVRIMVEKGLDGVLTIRNFLDCSYDWHSDS